MPEPLFALEEERRLLLHQLSQLRDFRPGSITVPKDAPPTFLVCADDDRSHVVTTVNLYLDLEKQGVSSEMHIYAAGGHGFGMRPSALPVATWPDRLRDWMKERKILKNQ